MTTYSVWPSTDGGALSSDTATSDLAAEVFVTSSGLYLLAYRWWCPAGADTAAAHSSFRLFATLDGITGSLVAGSEIAAGSFTDFATGWNLVTLGTPIPLVLGARYRATITYTGANEHYGVTSSYFVTGGGSSNIINGPLTCPTHTDALNDAQGSFNEPSSSTMPVTEFEYANYWIDVVVGTLPPAVSSLLLSMFP